MANPDTPAPITDAHTTCLLDVIAGLSCAQIGLPRLFFQSLQQTSLKLAVTPQSRNVNEPVGVSSSHYIAVKVEGVITTTTLLSQPLRIAKAVKLTLASQLLSAKTMHSENGTVKPLESNQTLEQTAEPHNDFFTGQFLLPFAVPGTHQVNTMQSVLNKQYLRTPP